ncbi:MAG: hypothetical protein FP831_04885 [Anaerolineae bacterium]|nr:hypothetical protein [Anaerolineae bacterium]
MAEIIRWVGSYAEPALILLLMGRHQKTGTMGKLLWYEDTVKRHILAHHTTAADFYFTKMQDFSNYSNINFTINLLIVITFSHFKGFPLCR